MQEDALRQTLEYISRRFYRVLEMDSLNLILPSPYELYICKINIYILYVLSNQWQ